MATSPGDNPPLTFDLRSPNTWGGVLPVPPSWARLQYLAGAGSTFGCIHTDAATV